VQSKARSRRNCAAPFRSKERGTKKSYNKEEQAYEKRLAIRLPSGEKQQKAGRQWRSIHKVPVTERALRIRRVHADDEDGHRPTNIVDEEKTGCRLLYRFNLFFFRRQRRICIDPREDTMCNGDA
jgi:hypothetical protein